MKTLWEICRDDLNFFSSVLDLMTFGIQSNRVGNEDQMVAVGNDNTESPGILKRDMNNRRDRCWYHCHEKDLDCVADLDNELPSVEAMEE